MTPDDKYTGTFTCSGHSFDVTLELFNDGYECFWKVWSYAAEFEALIPIDYGVSCEDFEMEVSVTAQIPYGACDITLSFSVDNLQPLPDEERDYRLKRLCNCQCVCEELCYRLTGWPYIDPSGRLLWERSSAKWKAYGVPVEVELVRNEYTDACEVLVTIDGTEYGPLPLGGCNRDVEFTVVDETHDPHWIGVFRCVNCNCSAPCCEQGNELTCTVQALGAECGCLAAGVFPLNKVSGDSTVWEYNGDPGTCFPPNPMNMSFSVSCNGNDDCSQWILRFASMEGCAVTSDPIYPNQECSCDPLYLEFDVTLSGLGSCCEGGMIPGTQVRFIITL